MKDPAYNLNEDENELLTEYESGMLKSASDLAKRKEELQSAARNTSAKNKNINIRVSERDLLRLKAKAMVEGIPYQTLVSSILHKAVSDHPTSAPTNNPVPNFMQSLRVSDINTTQTSAAKENHNE